MNSREKGNEGEKFVADYLARIGLIVEIHPRTFRKIIINGREMWISKDNDFHNCFDIKAEGLSKMIYAQVKYEEEKSNASSAQKHIDKLYPYTFPYIRVQVWQVWKEWARKPRRHKEFMFRVWERTGYETKVIRGIHKIVGAWEEITPQSFLSDGHTSTEEVSGDNYPTDAKDALKSIVKKSVNKNRKVKS